MAVQCVCSRPQDIPQVVYRGSFASLLEINFYPIDLLSALSHVFTAWKGVCLIS